MLPTPLHKLHLIPPEHRQFAYRFIKGTFLVLLGIGIGWLLFDHAGYFTNLYTELMGIVVTIVVLNTLTKYREERREYSRLRADLGFRISSSVNGEAIRAVEELRRHGWLQDGSLEGVELERASLQDADLHETRLNRVKVTDCNLQQANLFKADLRSVELVKVDLSGAYVDGADLSNMISYEVNLQQASLISTELENAALLKADLRGANLRDANLLNASLGFSTFDETTILPDNTCWTPNTDISRFTDTNHPDFWSAKRITCAATTVTSTLMTVPISA